LAGPACAVPEDPRDTLDAVFRRRVRLSPDAVAYVEFDPARGVWRESTWADTARAVARWQAALLSLGLHPGDRVALMLRNGTAWVVFDQAALRLGLVTVPLYPGDRPENVDWVLRDSGARVLLIEGSELRQSLRSIAPTLHRLTAVITLEPVATDAPNLHSAPHWLPERGVDAVPCAHRAEDLATLVYTSGTTGRPKGVMLSHRNILFNAHAGLRAVQVTSDDCLLSFLPLSHMLERSIGYYLPMIAGCRVAYARSIRDLPEDLLQVRPTILIAVPRVFERVHSRIRQGLQHASPLQRWLFGTAVELGWQRFLHRQGRGSRSTTLLAQPLLDRLVGARIRARLGGRLRFAISGGAPLPAAIGRVFLALGVEILQGYGLTETSPVISVNRSDDNEPTSVGPPLPGVEVGIGAGDELLTRGPAVMSGYWNNAAATRALIDDAGWLHTGDRARIGPRGHITITGRLKDIIVLSNGEKIAPADVEQALLACPLVEQVMVVGDGRPFLAALVVPQPDALAGAIAARRGDAAEDSAPIRAAAGQQILLEQLQPCMSAFPGYAKLAGVAIADAPWDLESGLLTPTMKLKRRAILDRYRIELEQLYAEHTPTAP
jgi:long-chain acyl-CoA synthetase